MPEDFDYDASHQACLANVAGADDAIAGKLAELEELRDGGIITYADSLKEVIQEFNIDHI